MNMRYILMTMITFMLFLGTIPATSFANQGDKTSNLVFDPGKTNKVVEGDLPAQKKGENRISHTYKFYAKAGQEIRVRVYGRGQEKLGLEDGYVAMWFSLVNPTGPVSEKLSQKMQDDTYSGTGHFGIDRWKGVLPASGGYEIIVSKSGVCPQCGEGGKVEQQNVHYILEVEIK